MRWTELEEEQKRDLDTKIQRANSVIARAASVSQHRMALAFSAGKDSTVLADLIRRFHPEVWHRLHLIYGNTGVEYPECVRFWRRICEEWQLDDRAHEARPAATEEPGYRYDAQCQIWQWAIRNGRIADVLKEDGKLKSTKGLERLASEMPGGDRLLKARALWWTTKAGKRAARPWVPRLKEDGRFLTVEEALQLPEVEGNDWFQPWDRRQFCAWLPQAATFAAS